MKVQCLVCHKRCKGEVLRVHEQYVHRACFACRECARSLERGGFFLRDGQLYCPEDFARHFGVRCRACGEAATGEVATAMGATFHPGCFRCRACRAAFSPGDRVVLRPDTQDFVCRPCADRQEAAAAALLRQPLSVATDVDAGAAHSNGRRARSTDLLSNSGVGASNDTLSNGRHLSNDALSNDALSNDGLGSNRGGPSNQGLGSSRRYGNARGLSNDTGGLSNGVGRRRARSYLSIQSETDGRLPPSNRYRRGVSPSPGASLTSLTPRPRHFHVPLPPAPAAPATPTTPPTPPTPRTMQTSSSRRSRSASRPGSVGGWRHRGGGGGTMTSSASSVAGGGWNYSSDDAAATAATDPVLLSQFPGGSRPELDQPAPIEREDWPCPPFAPLALQRHQQRSCQRPASRPREDDEAATGRRHRRQQLDLGGLGSALFAADAADADAAAVGSSVGGRSGGGGSSRSMRFSDSSSLSRSRAAKAGVAVSPSRPSPSTSPPPSTERVKSGAASPRPGYTLGLLSAAADSEIE